MAIASRSAEPPDELHWHAIGYLSIERCSVAEDDVVVWEKYVPDLRWDGMIGDAHWPHAGSELVEEGGKESADNGE